MSKRYFGGLAFFLCLLFSSGTPQARNSMPSLLPATEAPASATPLQSPSTSTPSLTAPPNPTLPVTPSAATDEKAIWKDNLRGFAILYPRQWHETRPSNPGGLRFEGKEGYVELKEFVLAGGLDALRDCRLESIANPDERYGVQPDISLDWWHSDTGTQFVDCIVQSKDQPEQHPQLHFANNTGMVGYVIIETGGSAQSLVTFADVPITAPAQANHLPITPHNQPIQSSLLDFTISQWRIASADLTKYDAIYFSDSPNEYSLLKRRYDALDANSPSDQDQLKQINADLSPFGYQLKSSCVSGCEHPTYQLFQGSRIIKEGLISYDEFSISQDRKNFVLGLSDEAYQGWLLTSKGLEPYPLESHHYRFPMYKGQHLISLSGDWDIVVEEDGQPIFNWKTFGIEASPTVPEIFVVGDQLVIEIRGVLVVDGEIWNLTKFPADDIFNARLLDDKLFFFYRRGTEIGIYYDGETIPTNFTIIHHDGCCGYGMNNPFNFSRSINFFAVEDGVWNYIEISLR